MQAGKPSHASAEAIAGQKDLCWQNDDQRWEALLTRDPAADGHFVYAVKTTGIYATPSTPSRCPQRHNVEFFATPAAAEAAGYRRSRREGQAQEHAVQARAQLIETACRLLDQAEHCPGLATLAAHVGLSPAHFHRLFKTETGITPKAYHTALRAQRLRQQLRMGPRSITDALYNVGFNASSRFYATAQKRLGMRAHHYRRGGPGMVIHFAVGCCTLGDILVAQSVKGVCAIFIGDDPEFLVQHLQDQFPQATLIGGDRDFEAVIATVVGFVEQPELGLALPLDIQGTAFQERVWQALCEVPLGETVSYTEIAAKIGTPRAVRAVAGACAANRLAVAIPCHRIVRRDGQLSGYRWGIERKQQLLERERASVANAVVADPLATADETYSDSQS